jgi:prepilin-type N-terminal cleavage/methylation domain-containing protein
MNNARPMRGFTLIELMIAVAIIALLSAIALPLYNGYVQTSREGVLLNNIASIRVFQEDALLRTGAYVPGNYDVAGGDTSLSDPPLNWDPRGDDDIVYQVVLVGDDYRVTATDEAGVTVCRQYPDDVPCP